MRRLAWILALAAVVVALASCQQSEPPVPQRISGSFDRSPAMQVAAEANAPGCQGTPRRVEFEVKLTANLIPADSRTGASFELSGDSDFKIESVTPQFVENNKEVIVKLSFRPTIIGPRFATLKLKLPRETNRTAEITLPLIGLGTCHSENAAIADRDGDGIKDSQDTKPFNPDRDDDGIPDGTEDKNSDGLVDPNETDPDKKDTDGDDVEDGAEDLNRNGIVEDGERDPKRED